MIAISAVIAGLVVSSNPVWVTTYHQKYYGRKTASGEIFVRNKDTVAVPFGKGRKPKYPFGTLLEFRYKGRKVVAKVNDICPAGTYDLSQSAMTKLLGKFAETKVRATMRTISVGN